jgi:hypothetical protein
MLGSGELGNSATEKRFAGPRAARDDGHGMDHRGLERLLLGSVQALGGGHACHVLLGVGE